MPEDMIRIMGVDPALRVSGYAVIEFPAAEASTGSNVLPASVLQGQVRIVEAGVIRVPEKPPLEERLVQIHQSLGEILDDLKPSHLAIEKLFAHYERTQPAILMGHARGTMMLAAGQRQIPVTGYGATEIKKTVSGNGRAPKTQMQSAVCRHLGLTKVPEPHDVADALAIALCHYFACHSVLRNLGTAKQR